jgi:hypothetical protein
MSQSILVLPGSTLFHIAAAYLNDASQWSRLALINNLADPFLSNTEMLVIPDISTIPRQASANSP